jgi:hypothetical protein
MIAMPEQLNIDGEGFAPSEGKGMPTLEEMRARQKAYAERHGQSDEWTFTELAPEYAKKLYAPARSHPYTYDEVKQQFVSYVCLYSHNEQKKWDYMRTAPDNYRRIITTMTDQMNFLLGIGRPAKSLLLIGVSGRGKTTIMSQFVRPSFYMMKLNLGVVPYIDAQDMHSDRWVKSLQQLPVAYIDDLGLELNTNQDSDGNFVKTEHIAFKTFDVLDHRRKHHLITNITTNMGIEDMVNVYGARSVWRFEEQFEVIIL